MASHNVRNRQNYLELVAKVVGGGWPQGNKPWTQDDIARLVKIYGEPNSESYPCIVHYRRVAPDENFDDVGFPMGTWEFGVVEPRPVFIPF